MMRNLMMKAAKSIYYQAWEEKMKEINKSDKEEIKC